MALVAPSASSKLRDKKPCAIRSFPPPLATDASSTEQPPTPGRPTNTRNLEPSNPNKLSSEPTSCGPGSDFISYRGKVVRRPVAFAIRNFPKDCGSASPKLSHSKEASIVVAKGTSKEGSDLDNVREDVVRGRLSGEVDAHKPHRKGCQIPDGTESKREMEKAEKLNDVVSSITEEVSGLEKTLGKSVVSRNVSEKPTRKNSTEIGKAAGSESKKELNGTVRGIPEGKIDSGKMVKKAVVGRSSSEKDGKKPNTKSSPMPYLVEDGKHQSGQLIEVLGDRVVVLALMSAKRCPWMQNKRKSSAGIPSRTKKTCAGEVESSGK